MLCTTLVHRSATPMEFLHEADISVLEEHYAQEREGIPEAPRVLLKSYIDKGWLGRKTGRGFYQYN
jgi:3-hydroxybutyryl-CoA dehydrogenase